MKQTNKKKLFDHSFLKNRLCKYCWIFKLISYISIFLEKRYKIQNFDVNPTFPIPKICAKCDVLSSHTPFWIHIKTNFWHWKISLGFWNDELHPEIFCSAYMRRDFVINISWHENEVNSQSVNGCVEAAVYLFHVITWKQAPF